MSSSIRADEVEKRRSELLDVINKVDAAFHEKSLREQVRELIPVDAAFRELSKSLLDVSSGKKRILEYLRRHPYQIIAGDELRIIAGISEWARRLRQLRVEDGWPIVSGLTATEMGEEDEFPINGVDVTSLRPDDYILLSVERDEKAAKRWKMANGIRRRTDLGVQARLLIYMRNNIGEPITGEELRYVATNSTEWARRVRELRTEEGWPISTHYSGRPDLPSGVYVLEEDRQLPAHDRKISDRDRRRVLQRDAWTCLDCGWTHDDWNSSDPRHLDLHHLEYHAKGGANAPDNLRTLCNICHDERHAQQK